MFYYFLFALICALVSFAIIYDHEEKNADIAGFCSVIIALVVWGICWWLLPNIGWRFSGWIWILLLALFISFVISSMLEQESFAIKFLIALVLFTVLGLVYWFTTSEMFHHERYREMLQVTEVYEGDFQEDFVPIKPEEMIKVDVPLAKKYASAVLEQDASIGSVCYLRNYYRIRLQNDLNVTLATGENKILPLAGEIVYVSPLEHRSFWKWNKKKTTPGFIIVSAQRQNEVYFVTGINGEKLELRYLESACFGDYIRRYIRKSGYLNGVENLSFVLDPNGRPFITATLYRKTIGFSGKKVTGMLTVDVQTGDIREYNLDELPSWVDRVYSEELIGKYIDDWGEYPQDQGYWNSVFAQNKVRKMTPGMTALYNEGERYIYTGIQSAGADDGTSGIMMINSRTGKATVYPLQGGANEESTRTKFEQNYKIDAAEVIASEVIIYPVKGENLYFTTLKGHSGDFLGYGVSSVKYRELAGVGKSIDEALLNYYMSKRNANLDTQVIGDYEAQSKVYKVSLVTMEDGLYYFRFEGVLGKEYMALPKLSKELKWTKAGDEVQVSYSQSMAEDESVMLETFENLDFVF